MESGETTKISITGRLSRDPIYLNKKGSVAKLDIRVVRADGADIWTVLANGEQLVDYLKAHQARKDDFVCVFGTAEETGSSLCVEAAILCLDTSATWRRE